MDTRRDVERLVALRDRIEALTALGRGGGAYVVMAPPGWFGDVVEVFGMPVIRSTSFTRPWFAIDPLAEERRDAELLRGGLELVAEMDAEFGPPTDEERAELLEIWPRKDES